jgi:selenocysteine-specific translation elongation factor
MTIDSGEMAQLVADEIARIKKLRADNEEKRLTIIRAIDKAKEPVNALFKPALDLLDRAIAIGSGKLLAWNDARRREREEAQRKLDEEARQRAAAAEAEAAKVRAKAEEDAKKLRDAAEAAAAAGRIADAAKLEVQADNKLTAADVKIERLVTAVPPAPVLAPEAKLAGANEATTYSAEVTDLAALIAYVAANPMFVNLLQANGPALNSQARALKEAYAIPGTKLVRKTGLRSTKTA